MRSPRAVLASAVVTIGALCLPVLPGGAAWAAAKGGGAAAKTGPSIAITSPAAGAVLKGTVTVSGTTSDRNSVSSVAVSVDGAPFQAASGTSSWSYPLVTTSYGNGAHTVTVRMVDSAGATATTAVSVTFSNGDTTPPTISIAAPSSGSTTGGSVTLYGAASDNTSVANVKVSVDGGPYQPASGTTYWTASVDTTKYANGSHTLAVMATDTAGNTATTSESLVFANFATAVAPPAMATGTIGGYTYQDPNRDGTYESGETPLTNQHLDLYDASGTCVSNTYSDSNGWYQFTGLASGTYTVRFAPDSWWSLWQAWVPDTTGTVYPSATVSLTGTGRLDVGWRQIVRSTAAAVPISSYSGSNGLVVRSYDDAVAASTIYGNLLNGTLIGAEAASGTVVFDYAPSVYTSTMASQSNGSYTSFDATSFLGYTQWLNQGDYELFYEYGHIWAGYYSYLMQQDGGFGAYLQARGLLGNPNLYSSMQWMPYELIADDYRQLFGDAGAQAVAPLNSSIPPAAQVPGLKAFLSGAFMQAASGPIGNTILPPAPTGTAQQGQTISETNPGEWMGVTPRTYAYEWQRCDSNGAGCVDVTGGQFYSSAGLPAYTATTSDVGSTIRIAVTVANSLGSATALSPATPVVSR